MYSVLLLGMKISIIFFRPTFSVGKITCWKKWRGSVISILQVESNLSNDSKEVFFIATFYLQIC